MSRISPEIIDSSQAREFLTRSFDPAVVEVEPIGAGAWSRCFAFRRGAQRLVARFGRHVDDFQKDQRAYAYHSADLPIPEVLAIGRAFDGYYAISTRVDGIALETLDAGQWRAVIPALANALEALRAADISAGAGFGGWGGDGKALYPNWGSYLLACVADTPDKRTYGWRAKLATLAAGEAAFNWGLRRLEALRQLPVPRCLIHGDLINRNVLVEGAAIGGVFDWGCAAYGDHLYDLAWFEFWAPWHPELDIAALRAELERRWQRAGYLPAFKQERLAACYLHIGLDHLAYNAYLDDWPTLLATADRMRALVGE